MVRLKNTPTLFPFEYAQKEQGHIYLVVQEKLQASIKKYLCTAWLRFNGIGEKRTMKIICANSYHLTRAFFSC